MSWLGFPLYRATLWVIGEPAGTRRKKCSRPSALQLDYRRDIPRERLVQTSIDEMRRLGASEPSCSAGNPSCGASFPMSGRATASSACTIPAACGLFHRGRPTGEVRDAQFARLFFAIWLDPRSRSPSLRAALLKRPGRAERVRPPGSAPAAPAMLAYGAFGLPLAMAALPVYVHVPRLYAEIGGMSLSLLGALLLAARLLDAGIDPLARRLERPDDESPAPDRHRPALPRDRHAGPAASAAGGAAAVAARFAAAAPISVSRWRPSPIRRGVPSWAAMPASVPA
jgi:hypothetical protein